MKLMLYHYSEDPTVDDRTTILETMRKLPTHPEVPEALRRLKPVGYRLVTRTNSPPAVINAQLAFAGIANMFEMSLSVDAASKFKPHRAAYDTAARRLDAVPADLMLVTAHNWDTPGAIAAGWQVAFVARPGMVQGPLDATQQLVSTKCPDTVHRVQLTPPRLRMCEEFEACDCENCPPTSPVAVPFNPTSSHLHAQARERPNGSQ